MDKDFELSESTRKAKQQDRTGFNNEMAGHDTGRMVRFGAAERRSIKEQEKEKRKRSALDNLLQNTEYRAAWTNTFNALNDADQAVYNALIHANENLVIAQKEHEEKQSEASQEKLEQAEEHYNQVQEHELRLAEIREEIEDENNPASIERLNNCNYSAPKSKFSSAC